MSTSIPALEKILYVEDDPDIQSVAQFALEELGGFTVAACSSGAEALTRAPTFQPQLVILDVMMPDMDGPTTLAELRRLTVTADTPVIFMTAKVQPQEIVKYKALGIVDVISKPFDPMILPDTIKSLWETHHGRTSRSILGA